MRRYALVTAAFAVALMLACAEDDTAEISSWSVYRGPMKGGVSLRDAGASGPNDVWAVGARGKILHYDGVCWTFYPASVTDFDLNAVTITSGSSGWAVGADGVVLRYHNGQWYNTVHLTGYDLYGVDFDDAGTGFAVGDHGAIFRYDGESWRDVSLVGVTADLREVAVGPGGTAWAVGDVGTVLYYEGGSWREVVVPTAERLHDVTLGGDGAYAVGDDGVILHQSGGSWNVVPTPATASLLGVDAAGDVAFACGNDGALLGMKDGAWGPVRLEMGPVNLNGVVLCNGGEGWAVGDQGVILRYHRVDD
ncbi:MAG TPA: hypothetical protein VMX79_08920 [bacterium]|nr:hypothetical protein [bacterium]